MPDIDSTTLCHSQHESSVKVELVHQLGVDCCHDQLATAAVAVGALTAGMLLLQQCRCAFAYGLCVLGASAAAAQAQGGELLSCWFRNTASDFGGARYQQARVDDK